jgi:hypothetical protein
LQDSRGNAERTRGMAETKQPLVAPTLEYDYVE